MSQPNIVKQTVIVEPEPSGAGWLILLPSGQVIWRRTAERVVDEIRKRDRETVRRVRGVDGCITSIEWRNVPEGFKPPERSS